MSAQALRKIGTLLGAVLVMFGVCVLSAASYSHQVVREQLGAQRITMPTNSVIDSHLRTGLLTEADATALRPFEGQQMINGPQARAYADHYIAPQLRAAAAAAKVPPELATVDGIHRLANDRIRALREELRALPENRSRTDEWIAAQVHLEFTRPDSKYLNAREAAVFRRLLEETFVPIEALRGVLLNAYGWWLVGSISYIAGAVSTLGGLGLIAFSRGWTHRAVLTIKQSAGVAPTAERVESKPATDEAPPPPDRRVGPV